MTTVVLCTQIEVPKDLTPTFRGFIGWVSNKGGGGIRYVDVQVDIFHKDYSDEYRKPDNYFGEYLTFLLPQWYIDSSLSSSSL